MFYKKLYLYTYKIIQEDLKLVFGKTWNRDIYVYDALKSPVDLTGATVYLTVKTNLSDTDTNAVISKEFTVFDDATAGNFCCEITAEEAQLTGNYYFDLVVKLATEEIYTIYSGTMNFSNTVTKRSEA